MATRKNREHAIAKQRGEKKEERRRSCYVYYLALMRALIIEGKKMRNKEIGVPDIA